MNRTKKINPILNLITQKIYQDRKPLPEMPRISTRYEKVQDKVFSEIWFMTPGCSHDRNGGCTMCNYGKGHYVSHEKILQELGGQIEKLPENLQELIVTPTGSMLDDREVPRELFVEILKLLENVITNVFLIETRADTVAAEKLKLMQQYIHADRIFIEIGVEACNDWILRNCVNKNMNMEELEKAVEIIHDSGMYACANIGIGIPFLNERMSIITALDSVKTAFRMGFDTVVLFPYHVKPGTLSAYLWEQGEYRCCSLWALIQALEMLPQKILGQVHISWYRNYYDDKKKILRSPDTCDACREEVLELLDLYRNYPGAESMEKLRFLSCGCRKAWKEKVFSQPDNVDMDRIAMVYRWLGKKFGVSGEIVEQEINYMDMERKTGLSKEMERLGKHV